MTCDQAQKELLDAELDFHKKMSSGEDTTDLKRKLGQLQVEVHYTLSLTHSHTHRKYTWIETDTKLIIDSILHHQHFRWELN